MSQNSLLSNHLKMLKKKTKLVAHEVAQKQAKGDLAIGCSLQSPAGK
jgi:hypothetical protein